MRVIIRDYFKGREGNGEIAFVRRHGADELVFTMYDGYFDNIMDAVSPEENGWTSLALFYHTDTGWNESSDWKVSDMNSAIDQLKSVEPQYLSKLECTILRDLIDFMSETYKSGDNLFIEYR